MQNDILEQIAKEKNLDVSLVRKVVASSYEFAKQAIKEKKSFRFPYLGMFVYNQAKADKLESMFNKDKEE